MEAPTSGSAAPGAGSFTGRHLELAQLDAALADAVSGRGRAVLVEGDAGIGKSALVDRFATMAAERGARVVWARCWESGGAPVHWPWVLVVRSLLESAPTEVRSALATLVPDGPAAPEPQSEHARFAVFDNVARLLRDQGQAQPLLVVIEDLHAADRSSLQLLRFVTSQIRDARCLLLGTWRTGPDAPDGADEQRVEVERDADVVPLSGLSRDDLAGLLRDAGAPGGDDAVTLLHDATGGNPLFVGELLRLLRNEDRLDALRAGAPLPMPPSVGAVLERRISRLHPAAVPPLALLAVAGREVDRRLAASLVPDAAALAGAVAAAATAGLMRRPHEPGGRYRFPHALVQAAFAATLSPADAADAHARVAAALETLHADDLDPHLAALARHYTAAGTAAVADKAFVYALSAGARARRLLAFEDAAQQYLLALDLAHSLARPPDDVCEILLSLGEAQLRAGDNDRGRATVLRAWDIAVQLGSVPMQVRAAMIYGLPGIEGGVVDTTLVDLISRVLPMLDPEDRATRAELRSRLGAELMFSTDTDRREREAREALADARASGDQRVLLRVLRWATTALSRVDHSVECVALLDELTGLARELDDLPALADATAVRLMLLVELGRTAQVEADVATLAAAAQRLPVPAHRWFVDVNAGRRALMTGSFQEAEELIARCLAFATDVPNAMAGWQFQQFLLAWEAGGLETFEPVMEMFPQLRPALADMAYCALCLIHAESGSLELARAELDAHAERVASVQVPYAWLLYLAFLAQAAYLTAHQESARLLYATLLPYADRHVSASARTAVGYWGSVQRLLANMSFVLGRYDDAARHGEAALQAHARVGARTFFTRSQYELARALLARRHDDDLRRAHALLREAGDAAARLGMTRLGRLVALELESAAAPEPATELPPSLELEGEVWTLKFHGRVSRLRDARGLHYLIELLRRPGEEVHALGLVAAVTGTGVSHGRAVAGAVGAADAGAAVLDPAAKAAYRERLRDLDEEIDRADEGADVGRAARLREEREFLLAELGRALGLGGRDRRLGADAAERARVNVTKQVKSAIRRISDADPELGAHLRSTVRTGAFCVYAAPPTRGLPWVVRQSPGAARS